VSTLAMTTGFVVSIILAYKLGKSDGYYEGYKKAEHEWRPQAGWTYVSSQCGWLRVPPKPRQPGNGSF